jgi:hypothetical protein
VASTSRSHAPWALLDEAIYRSASGSEIPVTVIGGFPADIRVDLGSIGRQLNAAARWQHVHLDFRFGSKADLTAPKSDFRFTPRKQTQVGHHGMSVSCQKRTLPQGRLLTPSRTFCGITLRAMISAFSGRINDARQFSINSLKLGCTGSPLLRGSTLEGDMTAIPEVSTSAVLETQINYAVNVIAMICGLGIVVSVCLATSGLDMSVGFF